MTDDPRYLVLAIALVALVITTRIRIRQNRRRAQYRGRLAGGRR